ncbi:hypothetical protein ABZ858_23470 [Streptomyces sp. NPDC047017]|uniref:hypothetical protein n=1 Tax=Streptomyces sp. NPDC047017 TaxID=3155024 RepID=UPI003407A1B9
MLVAAQCPVVPAFQGVDQRAVLAGVQGREATGVEVALHQPGNGQVVAGHRAQRIEPGTGAATAGERAVACIDRHRIDVSHETGGHPARLPARRGVLGGQ